MAFQLTAKADKANVLEARFTETETELVFTLPKHAVMQLAKASSTGDSQGMMLKLNGVFDYPNFGEHPAISGRPATENTPAVAAIPANPGSPIRVRVQSGRNGAGSWFSLQGTPLL